MRLLGFLLLIAGCVGDSTVVPNDAATDTSQNNDAATDAKVSDVAGGDGADAALVVDWTLSVPAKSNLYGLAVDSAGFVYIAGDLEAPLSLGSVNIASTQGLDGFVMKIDPISRQPVWAQIYGGTGDETFKGIALDSGGVLLTGTTTSLTMTLGTKTVTIPTSNGFNSHSFFMKLDPLDGSVVWAASPDSGRTASTAHTSNCTSIASLNKEFAVACSYQGAYFGMGPSAYDTSGSPWGIAVLRFADATTTFSQSWIKSLFAGTLGTGPVLSIDGTGNVWVGGEFQGTVALTDETLNGVVLSGATSGANIYALKITDSTQAIAPAKQWSASKVGVMQPAITTIAASGTSVFAIGWFGGTGAFGSGNLVSSGNTDDFALGLDQSLNTTWQAAFGGAGADVGRGIAPDGTGAAFVGLGWGSTGVSFGGTSLPDPPSGNSNAALAKYTASGTPGSALVSYSSSGSVAYTALTIDPAQPWLYAVGNHQGDTTFDDGAKATATVQGNGFLVRRAKF